MDGKLIMIGTEFKKGRLHYTLKLDSEPETQPSYIELLQMLSGSLALLIRSAKEDEVGITESDAMRTVINYLNNEFINSDSFNDLKRHIK